MVFPQLYWVPGKGYYYLMGVHVVNEPFYPSDGRFRWRADVEGKHGIPENSLTGKVLYCPEKEFGTMPFSEMPYCTFPCDENGALLISPGNYSAYSYNGGDAAVASILGVLYNQTEFNFDYYTPPVYRPRLTVRTRDEYNEAHKDDAVKTEVKMDGFILVNPTFDFMGCIIDLDFVFTDNYELVNSLKFFDYLLAWNRKKNPNFKFDVIGNRDGDMLDGLMSYLDAVLSNPRYVKFEDMDFIYVNPRIVYKDGKVVREFGLYDGNSAKSYFKVDGDGSIIYTQGYKTRDEALKNPLHSFTGGLGYTLEYDYKLSLDGKIIEDFTKPSEAGLMDLMYVK